METEPERKRSKMAKPISLRGAYFLAFLGCAGMLGFAYYLEYVKFLDPCPLCMVQRLVFYAIGVLFLLAAGHEPGRTGAWIYAGLISLVSILGVVTAGRHLWLQSLPPSEVPDCGPGLEYMIQNWPLAETVRSLIHASGDCAKVEWSFLGLSMPGWTLIWYLLFAVWALVWVAAAKPKRRRIFLDH